MTAAAALLTRGDVRTIYLLFALAFFLIGVLAFAQATGRGR